MLDVKLEGRKAVIDVRERILNGEHPRNEIFDYVKQASAGTIFEIHVPKRAQPLVNGLESLGLNVILNEIGPAHYMLVAAKLEEK